MRHRAGIAIAAALAAGLLGGWWVSRSQADFRYGIDSTTRTFSVRGKFNVRLVRDDEPSRGTEEFKDVVEVILLENWAVITVESIATCTTIVVPREHVAAMDIID